MRRYSRSKLRAHDLGVDRHSKTVSREAKVRRLTQEHTAGRSVALRSVRRRKSQ